MARTKKSEVEAAEAAEAVEVNIKPDVEKYVQTVAASGARSLNNGDTVAQSLAGATLDEVKKVASSIGVEDVDKYDHLNPGQARMNLGNRIRGALNKDESLAPKFEKVITSVQNAVAKRKAAMEKEKAKAKKAA